MLYAFAASEDYNPAPELGRIKAPLLAINSADDQVNPPELGIMEAVIGKVEQADDSCCFLLMSIPAGTARIRWLRFGSIIWLHFWRKPALDSTDPFSDVAGCRMRRRCAFSFG